MVMGDMGKILIFVGGLFVLAGIVFCLAGKVPGLGKLPGDILVKKENFTFYLPLTTSILISILLSFILFLWNRR